MRHKEETSHREMRGLFFLRGTPRSSKQFGLRIKEKKQKDQRVFWYYRSRSSPDSAMDTMSPPAKIRWSSRVMPASASTRLSRRVVSTSA